MHCTRNLECNSQEFVSIKQEWIAFLTVFYKMCLEVDIP